MYCRFPVGAGRPDAGSVSVRARASGCDDFGRAAAEMVLEKARRTGRRVCWNILMLVV